MKKNLTLPLICSSLVFFFMAGWFIATFVRMLVELNGDMIVGTIPALLGIVSLVGTLLVLREIYGTSKFWFLGIPHAIILIAVCIAGPTLLILGKPIVDGVRDPGLEFLFIPTALLSQTSMGFFCSYLNPKEKTTQTYILLSGIISLFAIVAIYFVALGPLGWYFNAGLEGIYWVYLMPIIGLCIIASIFDLRKLPG